MNKETKFIFKDELGNPVLLVKRIEKTGEKKKFFQYQMKRGEWVPGKPEGIQIAPLYWEDWKETSELVFLVEGEKDATRLKELGLFATTTPGGANSWKESYSKFFANKRVVIVPDNNEPGQHYANAAYRDLKAVTESIKIVNLPDLAQDEDSFNFIERFGIERFISEVCRSACLAELSNVDLFNIDAIPEKLNDILRRFSLHSDGSLVGCLAAIFAVTGVLVGRTYKVKHGWLNDFFLLVGPTGLARKTTIQSFAEKMLSKFLKQRKDFVIEQNDLNGITSDFLATVVSSFSVEGLQEVLQTPGVSLLCSIKEYRTVFDVSKRQNQSNTISVLTGLYDCNDLRHTTKGQDLIAQNYTFSVLASSTESWVKSLFSADNVAGGFLNRHLVINCPPSQVPNLETRDLSSEDWNQIISNLSDVIPLRKPFEKESIDDYQLQMEFESEEVKAIYDNFQIALHRIQLKDPESIETQVRARESTHALKIAAIHSLWSERTTISRDSILFGINWAKSSSYTILRMIPQDEKKFSKEENRVLKFISRKWANTKLPTRQSDLSKHFGGRQTGINNAIQVLIQNGQIEKTDGGYIPSFPHSTQ